MPTYAKSFRHSTNSVSGSFIEQDFVFEHGRRYCNDHYYLPNDDAEQTRLSVTHQAFLSLLDGQLCMTHIPQDIQRILDIGTGTGEWAIAVSERFPQAEVIATDITAYQPTEVPPNVFFEVDNALEEWTYTEPFDFIHIRGLTGAFPDWAPLYSTANTHLRPGGTLEIADFGPVRLTQEIPDSYVAAFNGAYLSVAEKAGITVGLEHMRKPVLEKAGLSVIKSKVFEVPLGTWSTDPRKKVAGKMALISALEGLEATGLRLMTRELAWKEKDVRDLCEKVQGELMRPDVRAVIPCQFIVARKILM